MAVALLLLAACGGSGDGDATPSTGSGDRSAERSTGTSVELSATSSSTTVGSPSSAGGPGPATNPAEGNDDGRRPTPERTGATTAAVPITDAAQARDAVLFVAEQTPFGPDTSPPLAIVDELRSAFTGLGIDDTGSTSASPTSLAIESSFLITDAGPTVIGFAVADTAGRCAGGVIGERETSPGSYRYEPEPTLFETVDTAGIATCNGGEVRQLWDVRHGHR